MSGFGLEAMGCLLQRLLQKTVRFVPRHLDSRPMSPGRFLMAPSHGSNEAEPLTEHFKVGILQLWKAPHRHS